MLKRISVAIMVLCLLGTVAGLTAQQGSEASVVRRAVRPGRARPMFGQWLDELSEAYEQNDREKMGELIEQMKQNRQRIGGRRGAAGDRRDSLQGRAVSGSPVDSRPIASRDADKKILSVLENMNANQRRGMMNVPPEDGRVLRLLTEAVGARKVVEIGTSNGYSGIWFCLALRSTGGKLITHEIDGARASLARENFKRAGVDDLITLVEGDAHEEVTRLKGPIDVLFIDADKEGYMDYLNKLLPLVRPGGLIIAHNTNMRSQMQDYIKAVTTSADLETVFLHEQRSGIGVTLKKR